MATIEVKGVDEFLIKLSQLEQAMKEEIIGQAIHEGAGIAADAIRTELNNLPTDESFGTSEHPATGIKAIQKAGLLYSFGISEMKDDGNGFLNVKIGFDGYNRVKTERWPNGQPNQMVARSIESGTTWLLKYPFMKQSVAKTKKTAVSAMKRKVKESTDEYWNRLAKESSKK